MLDLKGLLLTVTKKDYIMNSTSLTPQEYLEDLNPEDLTPSQINDIYKYQHGNNLSEFQITLLEGEVRRLSTELEFVKKESKHYRDMVFKESRENFRTAIDSVTDFYNNL